MISCEANIWRYTINKDYSANRRCLLIAEDFTCERLAGAGGGSGGGALNLDTGSTSISEGPRPLHLHQYNQFSK